MPEETVVETVVAPVVETEVVEPNAEVVSLKEDMMKYKRLMQKEASEKQELATQLETQKQERMAADGQWKELAESRLVEANDWKTKFLGQGDTIKNNERIRAVEKAALKANVRDSALQDLDMVDMSEVVVETTDTGRHTVTGAEDFVGRLKTARPHWFKDSTDPVIDNGSGNVIPANGKPSIAEILKLQKSDPAAYAVAIKNYNN